MTQAKINERANRFRDGGSNLSEGSFDSGTTGRVELKITIDETGSVTEAEIHKSSGFAEFDSGTRSSISIQV